MSEATAPTVDEVLEQLKAAGINPNAWGEMGDVNAAPLLLGEHLHLAKSLTAVLTQQETLLQDELRVAKEALHRIQHGGGF